MIVLTLNCGSSSIKYQMYDMKEEEVMAKGLVERIGIEGAGITHEPTGGDDYELTTEIPDHEAGIKLVVDALTDTKHGVLSSINEIDAVGHRVVHGGDKFSDSVIITKEVKEMIEEVSDLAPLHNPPALMGLNACEKLLGEIPQVAVFDTAFHQTMPEKNFTYALPYELCQKYKIRRYGFHGTSHKYVVERAAKVTGIDLEKSKAVTCHLGNGASISAIQDGKVVDTSMGFTPLEGLVMGTRCGNIDPAIIPYVMEKEGLDTSEVGNLMNKKSGVLGVSGISNDFRDLEEAAENGDERAQLALDIFVHYAKKIIGAYAAVLNGIDLLVFTAGLGENSISIREKICEDMDYLGIKLDKDKNAVRGVEAIISPEEMSPKIAVIPTNEELMIARDTKRLVF